MRKLSVVLVVVFALAACGGDDSSSSDDTTTTTSVDVASMLLVPEDLSSDDALDAQWAVGDVSEGVDIVLPDCIDEELLDPAPVDGTAKLIRQTEFKLPSVEQHVGAWPGDGAKAAYDAAVARLDGCDPQFTYRARPPPAPSPASTCPRSATSPSRGAPTSRSPAPRSPSPPSTCSSATSRCRSSTRTSTRRTPPSSARSPPRPPPSSASDRGRRVARSATLDGVSTSEGSGAGLRALVVDDDAPVRRLIRTVLELEGWEVVEADEGELALLLAAHERPHRWCST